MFSALDQNRNMPSANKERLVLRSGVGASKSLRSQPPAEVVDSWEDAEEKEEEEEREHEKVNAEAQQTEPQETLETAPVATVTPVVPETLEAFEQNEPAEATEVPIPDVTPTDDEADAEV
jgi:transcriptional repressor NF-X1